MKSSIVFIDTSDIGAAYSAEAAISLGYEPIFIYDANSFLGDTKKQIHKFRCYITNTNSADHIIEVIQNQIQNVHAVMTFLDSKLEICIQVAKRLNLISIDQAILSLIHKSSVYNLIPMDCPESIIFDHDDIPLEKINAMLTVHKKIIIKPTNASGGLGILAIESSDDFNSINAHITRTAAANYRYGKTWIAQAFISGQLFSFEGYICGGKLNKIGMTRRQKIGNTETYNEFPADDKLSEESQRKARIILENLFFKSDFKNGYFHSEFIINSDECYLIDVNAGRLGGGAIGEQIALAYNKSPIDIFKHVISISLGNQNTIDHHSFYTVENKEKTISINYGVRNKCQLDFIELPQNMLCFHTQLLDPKSSVMPLGSDNWSWIGLISGYQSDVLDEITKIKIHTDIGIFAPAY